MSDPDPIRIWTHGACNPHGGHGGWAYVMVHGDAVRGEAGGARGSSPAAMAQTAVLRALTALGSGAEAVVVMSADPALLAGQQPEVALATALAARSVSLRAPPPLADPKSAFGFVQAWSAFAVDKVKSGGPFTAPIPKPNLQKFPGLRGVG